jgi:glycosyltransferase involved in cell wall biosynthesis
MKLLEFLKIHVADILFSLFALITFIQLCYYWLFFNKLAFYKPPYTETTQQHPITVVVCARDEAANLAHNLPGILVQNYASSHEVIVVNDNSVDETKYLLEELKKTFKHLKVVNLTHEAKLISGKKYPLSIGLKEARHELVLLTDADCVPATEFWMQKMQNGFVPGTDIVLGYGAYLKKKGWLNKIIRFETFHTALQYLSYALAGTPYMGVGRNLAYTKTLFLHNKGFSSLNQIPGGDDDLFVNKVATRFNTRIVIDKESFTQSEPKYTWSGWVRQKTRHYSTGKFYKGKHRLLLGTYSLTHFLFYPFFIASIFLFDWRFVLAVFALRFVSQAFVFKKTMARLNEKDLWPWWWLLDIWMMAYYVIFAPSIWKKPQQTWS